MCSQRITAATFLLRASFVSLLLSPLLFAADWLMA